MKKISILLVLLMITSGIYSPSTIAEKYDENFCDQFEGVKKIMWEGLELRFGQIEKPIIEKDTPLFKLDGDKKVFSRTLRAGEFYRIYSFKPGMLDVGGGYFVDRDQDLRIKHQVKQNWLL
ncbi:hypothetical protein IMZ08_03895 [Bacillus luteolus]|uniref:Uncharacterized protein n=1 Tax=Litchfieldia luteola TaxID=682179 RepID=A0ABR9QFE0_9BACI|nr:hypothetical protein [Cytobacillus luteolus]MBE4907200.1 hypothetical protein [Cytobacillus luteolus]MBP1943326.1 hypothetical protein [Cytobacillus luteolus]